MISIGIAQMKATRFGTSDRSLPPTTLSRSLADNLRALHELAPDQQFFSYSSFTVIQVG